MALKWYKLKTVCKLGKKQRLLEEDKTQFESFRETELHRLTKSFQFPLLSMLLFLLFLVVLAIAHVNGVCWCL